MKKRCVPEYASDIIFCLTARTSRSIDEMDSRLGFASFVNRGQNIFSKPKVPVSWWCPYSKQYTLFPSSEMILARFRYPLLPRLHIPIGPSYRTGPENRFALSSSSAPIALTTIHIHIPLALNAGLDGLQFLFISARRHVYLGDSVFKQACLQRPTLEHRHVSFALCVDASNIQ